MAVDPPGAFSETTGLARVFCRLPAFAKEHCEEAQPVASHEGLCRAGQQSLQMCCEVYILHLLHPCFAPLCTTLG